MPNTFELIASSTVGAGGANSIDFTSISGSYTDLVVKLSCRATVAAAAWNYKITLNGGTSGYSGKILYGTGSAAASSNGTSTYFDGIYTSGSSATASTFGSAEIYIPNYAGSNNKSISTDSAAETNATTTYMSLQAGLYSSSAAITSIKIQVEPTSDLAEYSTAYLYGVKNA
jgi:hypothetical protein